MSMIRAGSKCYITPLPERFQNIVVNGGKRLVFPKELNDIVDLSVFDFLNHSDSSAQFFQRCRDCLKAAGISAVDIAIARDPDFSFLRVPKVKQKLLEPRCRNYFTMSNWNDVYEHAGTKWTLNGLKKRILEDL